MNKEEFLNNLFKYYDLALRIDNVLGTKYNKIQIPSYHVSDKIDKVYNKKLEKSDYFSLDSDFKNNFLPIEYLSEDRIESFIHEVSYFERTVNFEGQKLKKRYDPQNIYEHNKFIFSKDSNFFQYGIAFNLLKENPFSDYSKFVPSFVILFPNYDEEFNFLTPDKIFIEIKRYLGYSLTEDEEEFSCEIKPYLLFNPKILEPYFLETPDIKLSSFEDTQKQIIKFLEPILELDKYNIEKEFQDKAFIIGISQNLNMGLAKIYDTIFEHKNINNLIKSYFNVHRRKINDIIYTKIEKSEIITTKKIVNSYSSHFGSFDKEYSLAQTQREALSCYLENKKVLPVNGAPGTGKTSLLRGIFGDYTVKAAIKSYESYLKEKVVLFSTPIVCSSTNNQALTNISEGIDSGFIETSKKNESNLYKRWLIDDIKLEKKTINFNNNLFVPSIRSTVKRTYELSKKDIKTVGNIISKNPLTFINEYFKYRKIDMFCEKVDKRTLDLLNKAARFFFNKINENIEELKSLTSYIQDKVDELSKIELYLVTKYIKKGIQEDLIKATLFEIKEHSEKLSSSLDRFRSFQKEYKQTEKNIQNLKNTIKEYKKEVLEIENSISLIANEIEIINKQIKTEQCYLNDYKISPYYSSCYEEIKNKYKDDFTNEKNNIKELLKTDIEKVFESANILEKLSYGLFKRGKIKDKIELLNNLSQEQLSNLNTTFYEQDFFINDLKENISNRHSKVIKKLKEKLSKIDANITKSSIKHSEIKLEIFQLESEMDDKDIKLYQIENLLDKEFGILSNDIFEFEDIEKLIEFEDTYKELVRLNKKNERYDTIQRTDNFYFALHLLEALYFISNTNMWNSKIEINNFDNKIIKCPICHLGSMVQRDSVIKCSKCDRKFSFNNRFLPKELDEEKILYILKNSKATIDEISYYVNATEDFINISTNDTNNDELFSSLYPIFPIINITCNSFGTIVSNRNDTYVRENIFDFLLIDEAGTIPPSKMIILNCAKKVMLFGDTKQLKPVFSYDSKVENRILEDFYSSKKDISIVSKYFSCASKISNEPIIKKNNNSMDIANSSVNYFLPYNKSKMEGDIWLKEHFRCQTPIVQISNEISYFNEIKPLKKDKYHDKSWSTLLFIEHEHQKDSFNKNIGEVNLIIDFILDRKERYISEFLKKTKNKDNITDEDYYNSIGIITPFVNQESLLKKEIINRIGSHKDDTKEPIIKVGTVHKYQGSERDIIIFSSVYNKENQGKAPSLFFNRDEPDMINVAVTRAKEIFVLFGNRNTISNSETFSGVMVKHIDEYKNKKRKK